LGVFGVFIRNTPKTHQKHTKKTPARGFGF